MSQKEKFKVLVADEDPKLKAEIARALDPFDYGVEHTREGNAALRRAKPTSTRHGFSEYDLIVYSSQLTQVPWHQFLSIVRETDEYVPVVITGPGDEELAVRAVGAGALDFINRQRSDLVDTLVRHIHERLVLSTSVGDVTVVQVGDSALNYDDAHLMSTNLERVLNVCKETRSNSSGLIVTAGDGVFGGIQRRYLQHHHTRGSVSQNYAKRIRKCVDINVRNICDLLGDRAKYITPDNFATVTEQFLMENIAVMPFAPVPLYRRHKLPFDDPDIHTIATAEFYRARVLVLLKMAANAFYSFDVRSGSGAAVELWIKAQDENSITGTDIHATDLIEERYAGTDSSDGQGHRLLTPSALRYFRDETKTLEKIYVVPIAPKELFVPNPEGYSTGNPALRCVMDDGYDLVPVQVQMQNALSGNPDGIVISKEPLRTEPRGETFLTVHQALRAHLLEDVK